MNHLKGIICGRGGEGVITLNKTLGIILTMNNYSVISSEIHGMAQRGGTVVTYLKIGEYLSPAVMNGMADFFISTNFEEYINNKHLINDKALAIVNNDTISIMGVQNNVYMFNAIKLSIDNFKTGKQLNQILAGFFLGIMKYNLKLFNNNNIIKYKFINIEALKLGFYESNKYNK